MLRTNSLKFKITVLAMMILAAILLIYSSVLFVSFRHMFYREMDSALTAKAQKINNAITSYMDVLGYDKKSFEFSVTRVISQKGEHPHRNKIEKLEKLWMGQAAPLSLESDYVEFLRPDGVILAYSNNLHSDLPTVSSKELQTALAGRFIYKDVIVNKERQRLLVMPVSYLKMSKNRNFVIVIASSRERLNRILNERLMTEAGFIVVILIIAFLLSQVFVKNVLQPIQRITETARSINYKDLSKRVGEEETDLEMKDLVDALNQMMTRLERSFKYIAEFSAHVSHELKTPLAILRGESELALRAEHSAGEYRRVIQDNLEQVTRMTKIVDDLLLLTKLDFQPQVFKFDDFDLVDFLKEIEESSHILAEEKQLKIETDFPAEPVLIHGDKAHLRRLFFNLINNAIKFTYPGGTIKIGMKKEGRYAKLLFSDTGVGIPEENLSKIFDKFFHHNSTGVDIPQGNGLGLSIVQSIAKIHGGEVTVSSRVGQGTTFSVRLPILN